MVKDIDNISKISNLEKDEAFQDLIKKYNAINGFCIMGKSHKELWHSEFVKWLLDPKENHGLGSFPLKSFWHLIISKGTEFEIDEQEFDEMKFETEHKIKYKSSNGRIDIFGISKSLILVIENKIDAKENFDRHTKEPQTNLYYQYCEDKYKNRRKCYIHLRVDSDNKVQNKNFIPITYQELFDGVIKKAYDECDKTQRSDTKTVLEQYAVYLSNPKLRKNVMAYTEKDTCESIYLKHFEAIELIRQTMNDINRDESASVCEFFEKYKIYINRVILDSLKKNIIKRRTSKKLSGKALIDALVEDNFLSINRTEMIYKTRLNKTFIIKLNEEGEFYTGYYDGVDYDGSQNVIPLMDENGPRKFKRYHDAAVEAEKAAGAKNINGGESVYEFTLINAGKPEAEGKTIREIYSY